MGIFWKVSVSCGDILKGENPSYEVRNDQLWAQSSQGGWATEAIHWFCLTVQCLYAGALGESLQLLNRGVKRDWNLFSPLTPDLGVPFEVAHLRPPDTTLQASFVNWAEKTFWGLKTALSQQQPSPVSWQGDSPLECVTVYPDTFLWACLSSVSGQRGRSALQTGFLVLTQSWASICSLASGPVCKTKSMTWEEWG